MSAATKPRPSTLVDELPVARVLRELGVRYHRKSTAQRIEALRQAKARVQAHRHGQDTCTRQHAQRIAVLEHELRRLGAGEGLDALVRPIPLLPAVRHEAWRSGQ